MIKTKQEYEDQKVHGEQKLLEEVTNHQGWAIVHRIFGNKVLDLQNSFNIENSTPEKMLIDLEARKLAATMLFDVLREVEGSSDQSKDNKPLKTSSFIEILPEQT